MLVTNSLKFLCVMFVYVLCKFVLGLIVCFEENLRFDVLSAKQRGDRLKFVLALMRSVVVDWAQSTN